MYLYLHVPTDNVLPTYSSVPRVPIIPMLMNKGRTSPRFGARAYKENSHLLVLGFLIGCKNWSSQLALS